MTQPARQQGHTLMVALIMLTLMTFMGVSALRMGTTNVEIAGNMQFQEEAVAAAQQALETVISDTAFTTAVPATQSISVTGAQQPDYAVVFDPAPACISHVPVDLSNPNTPAVCYGSGGQNLCFRTVWHIPARASDARTGAEVTVVQGVGLMVGLDSALAFCN